MKRRSTLFSRFLTTRYARLRWVGNLLCKLSAAGVLGGWQVRWIKYPENVWWLCGEYVTSTERTRRFEARLKGEIAVYESGLKGRTV